MSGTLDVQSMCYTLEVSMFGHVKRDNPTEIIPYTEESCNQHYIFITICSHVIFDLALIIFFFKYRTLDTKNIFPNCVK